MSSLLQIRREELNSLCTDSHVNDLAEELSQGWCAHIYATKYRDREAVAKTAKCVLRLKDDTTDRTARPLECLWCREHVGDGWFILRSFLNGEVLTRCSGNKLALHMKSDSAEDWNQHWILDSGALVSRKLEPFQKTPGWGGVLDVSEGKDCQMAEVILHQRHGQDASNQQWEFDPGFNPLPLGARDECPFAIVSKMHGRRLLMPKALHNMEREVAVLHKFAGPGLVELHSVIWREGCRMPSLVVMDRLKLQLGDGKGTLPNEAKRHGSVQEKGPVPAATVAQRLLPVAQFLERLHDKGLTHGDLHEGNILSTSDLEPWNFVAIDMGEVSEADKVANKYGKDAMWLQARDIRALALHVVSLLLGKHFNFWEYINGHGEYSTEARAAPYRKVSFEDADDRAKEAPPLQEFLNKAFADSKEYQLRAPEAVQMLMQAAQSNASNPMPADSRQPEVADDLHGVPLLLLAFTEPLMIYGPVIALALLFASRLIK